MKKRRWLLPLICMMILVPTIAALVFSGYGIYQQQRAMVTMAQRYAQNLARSIVREESGASMESPLQRHRRIGLFLKMLTLGPPVPGWIATVGPNGVKLQGSPGSQITPALAQAVNQALRTNEMQTLTLLSDRHPPSAAAVCAFPDGIRAVVVVISHYLVPGSMMRAISFQPVMSCAVSLIALAGLFLLWKWCILPLRGLSSQVEELRWGKDVLPPQRVGPLPELHEMQKALSELSVSAVDREELKKNYVRDIVRTQEEERTRLAREIHDSPLQTVALLIQRIQLALRGLGKAEIDRPRVADHLTTAQEAALTAVQEMRDVCDRLSPPWTGLGAVRAFEEIADRLSRIFGIPISTSIDGYADELTEKDVLAFCRIIQEAAANSVRHGGASSVDVHMVCTNQDVTLTILDDGQGITGDFDPERLRVQGHRGIASMTERASLLGASFSIKPGPEGGTLITVVMPVKAKEKCE